MNPTTHSASTGSFNKAINTGRAPARYVPMAGMNWLTRPTHRASASGDGTPMIDRNAQVNVADNPASRSREYSQPPVFAIESSHRYNTVRWCSSGSTEQKLRRMVGPSAVM